MRLKLIRPEPAYGEQVMAYKAALLAHGDSLDGCAGLEDGAAMRSGPILKTA